jgi:hypothetical protein
MKAGIFLLAGCFSLLAAVDSAELFRQGNRFFEQGSFVDAIETYNKIENPSAVVMMNLGAAHFNNQELAHARLYFARACKMGPISLSWQAKAYDDLVKQRLNTGVDKTIPAIIARVCRIIPLSWLQFLILLCFIVIFYGLYLRAAWVSRFWIYLLLALLVVGWTVKYQQQRIVKAVVLQHSDLYIGPERSFLKKSVIPLGSVVSVLQQQETMVEVVANRQQGWIILDNLSFI